MVRLRSPRELAYRLAQQAANAWFAVRPPTLHPGSFPRLRKLPDPEPVLQTLRGSAYATEVERLAGLVLEHRFPLFDTLLSTGAGIEWRRDYWSGKQSGTAYFRFIPYLDLATAGDHKRVWEINRHQHLVLLAQAFRLSGRRDYLHEIAAEIESWFRQNPWMRGINWTSALEIAFRATSWLWVYHLAGGELPVDLRGRLLEGLLRAGYYLECNLSVYFSPNTHLLGEAVALHALGALLPDLPPAARWERLGARLVAEQMRKQVRADGSHFEQSAYYHVYALDLFLFHRAVTGGDEEFDRRLAAMADYLETLTAPSGLLPPLGDDDGGRFFHPYGRRAAFGRATLATCGALLNRPEWITDETLLHEQAVWWFGAGCLQTGPRPVARRLDSRLFPDAGVAVLRAGDVQIVADAGPFARSSAGHSHSDTLSLIVRRGDADVLIDPGTFCYLGPERDVFRSSAAHNTIRVDGFDQGTAAGPFHWLDSPEVEILAWRTEATRDSLDALCRYRGFQHRRRLVLLKPSGVLFVADQLSGPPGQHVAEQFWHPGEACRAEASGCFRIGSRAWLLLAAPEDSCELTEGGSHGWRSPVYGSKEAAPVLRVWREAGLPMVFYAVIDPRPDGAPPRLWNPAGTMNLVYERAGEAVTVNFAELSGATGSLRPAS